MANSAMLPSSVDTDKIDALLEPFIGQNSLSSERLKQVSDYLELLLKWNARMNLTAIRDPEEIVTRHFGESFFAAREILKSSIPSSAIDIGSGAGFPGLPLKIVAPQMALTLVESNQKKSTFLREVVRLLGFTDVNVFADRAESLKSKADLVTLRAVDKFESVLPVAGTSTATKGRIALLIGETKVKSAISSLPAIQWNAPVPIPLSEHRVVLIGRNSLANGEKI